MNDEMLEVPPVEVPIAPAPDPAPAPKKDVGPAKAPEREPLRMTLDRFLRTKRGPLVSIFRSEHRLKNPKTVKRSLQEWEQLYQQFLHAPRA